MSLSLGRQKQLLDIFDRLVHAAEDELHFREKAKEAIKGRRPYTTFVQCHKEAAAIADKLRPIVAEAARKMDPIRARWNKERKKDSRVSYNEFWSHTDVDNPIEEPEFKETEDGKIILRSDAERYNNDSVIDEELIGDVSFRTHVETLKASLKLALNERELVQALTEAKVNLTAYVEAEKRKKK